MNLLPWQLDSLSATIGRMILIDRTRTMYPVDFHHQVQGLLVELIYRLFDLIPLLNLTIESANLCGRNFEVFQRRLANLVLLLDRLPRLDFDKIHGLILIFVLIPLDNCRLFGGFVRDLYQSQPFHDLNLWIPSAEELNQLTTTLQRLGYRLAWTPRDPQSQYLEVADHRSTLRLCLSDDDFDRIPVDFYCNSLYCLITISAIEIHSRVPMVDIDQIINQIENRQAVSIEGITIAPGRIERMVTKGYQIN